MCSGCVLPPTEEIIEDFVKKCHLAIEWSSDLIEEEYNHLATEVIQHASTRDETLKVEEHVSLEDCLRKFHEVEDLGYEDKMKCTKCNLD